ncbi:MAG: protein kinase, partial [Candidatus Riflebacteria bacterium]|nr:protein kinase [Candidatus Riflebacteria bacterium]
VSLFESEALALASLEHDNVVRLYDYGIAGETPYLIMEYVRGQSLSSRLTQGRPTVVEAARIGRDVLAGIAAAHAKGIAHLDLKPSNVFLDEAGRAKVADFGLARSMGRGRPSAPQVIAGGTPGYMPPEQWLGEAGSASDVYAFGVVLHEAMTGQKLFPWDQSSEILVRQRAGNVPAPSTLNGAVPPLLDRLVGECLRVDPTRRPAVDALLSEMTAWLDRVLRASFLRAGLARALDRTRHELLLLVSGPDPARTVRDAVAGRAAQLGLTWPEGEAVSSSRLETEPELWAEILPRWTRASGRQLLIVVDQAEELFTQNARGSPRVGALFESVVSIVEAQAAPVKILISYRSEFRADFFPLEQRLGRYLHAFPLGEMSPAALEEAIEGPSRIEFYGFSYAEGLPRIMARDISKTSRELGDVALPALQIVCKELHDRIRAKGSRVIGRDLYEGAIGGVEGALEQYVERRLASTEYRHGGGLARQMLRALTVKEEGRERFARPRDEEELLDFPDRAAARQTLERLLADHLVIREERAPGARRIRLVSEVICPLIDGWDEEPDDVERAARLLARAYRHWVDQGRRAEDLLGGSALGTVTRHLGALKDVGQGELRFLEASNRRRGWLVGARICVAVAATCLSLFLLWIVRYRPGTLLITPHPRSVTGTVLENGRVVAPFPQRTPWSSAPGRHTLSLVAKGYETATLDAWVPVGGQAVYEPVLLSSSGIVQVSSDPPGAVCRLLPSARSPITSTGAAGPKAPSVASGATPLTVEVPSGSYDLEVSRIGYDTVVERIWVANGRQLTQRALRLVSRSGKLLVRSPFDGVMMELWDDSITPRSKVWESALPMKVPQELPSGRLRMECRREGSLGESSRIEVRKGTFTAYTAWVPPLREVFKVGRAGPVFVASGCPDLNGDGLEDPIVGPAPTVVTDEVVPDEPRPESGVSALSGADGSVLKEYPTDGALAGPPLVTGLRDRGGPMVLLAARSGKVRMVNALTAATLWTAATGPVPAPVTLVDTDRSGSQVLVPSQDGHVYILSGRTGQLVKKLPCQGPVVSPPVWADLDGDSRPELVVVVKPGVNSPAHEIRAIDAGDGGLRWALPTTKAPVAPAVALRGPDGTPVVVAQVGSGAVAMLSTAGRRSTAPGPRPRVVWERALDSDLVSAPALADVDGDRVLDVVVATSQGTVWGLSGRGGDPLFRCPTHERCLPGSPVLCDVDCDGLPDALVPLESRVVAVSGKSGVLLWERLVNNPVENRFSLDRLRFGLADVDGD